MKWKIFFISLFLILPFGIIIKAVGVKKTEFLVSSASVPTQTEKRWSLLEKIRENDELLKNTKLAVGSKEIEYYETRISRNGDKISTALKKYKDPEKEIALKLLDTITGEIKVVKIKKRGGELINPVGYRIEIVERLNGIRWNKWNTQYKVAESPDMIVLKNKYPDVDFYTVSKIVKDKKGKKRRVYVREKKVEEIIYSPYSENLHTPEIVEAGRQHIRSVVESALNELRLKKVYSRALPNTLVADVEALRSKFFERIPILEQSDLGEFLENPSKITERVLVIIGANDFSAFGKTGSRTGASGWVQFMPGTYKMIRGSYPLARLNTDFEKGTADHLNSMTAAILLYDYNLKVFYQKFGNNPSLEEYLAASYNGGAGRILQALSTSISARIPDWAKAKYSRSSKREIIRPETKGFLEKLRFLVANDLP